MTDRMTHEEYDRTPAGRGLKAYEQRMRQTNGDILEGLRAARAVETNIETTRLRTERDNRERVAAIWDSHRAIGEERNRAGR